MGYILAGSEQDFIKHKKRGTVHHIVIGGRRKPCARIQITAHANA